MIPWKYDTCTNDDEEMLESMDSDASFIEIPLCSLEELSQFCHRHVIAYTYVA